jgi:adenylate cyclase class IV
MAHNVEIKAAVADFAVARAALAARSPGPVAVSSPEDTFFRCATGRLKLRRLSAVAGELIHYERPDQPGPRLSRYAIVPTTEPDRLRDVLTAACGIIGVVRKRRTVHLVGRTRVHLDEVEGLARFIELEVVLDAEQPVEAGHAEARRLMVVLGIQEEQLVSQAYLDLLPARQRPGR